MVKFEFTVNDAEAEFIMSMFSKEICDCNENIQKHIMLEHRETDNQEYHKSMHAAFFNQIAWIKQLKEKVHTTRVGDDL